MDIINTTNTINVNSFISADYTRIDFSDGINWTTHCFESGSQGRSVNVVGSGADSKMIYTSCELGYRML